MEKYEGKLIFEGKDRYGPVEVVEGPLLRTLHFGTPTIQSSMYLNDPIALEMEYNRVMMLCLLFHPEPESALFLGLGGGSLSKFLWKHFSNCNVEAVEISPLVIRISHKYFEVPKDSRCVIYRDDAIHFLRSLEEDQYDLIFVDLFDEGGMSKVLQKPKLFQGCMHKLKSGGILIWNMWRTSSKEMIEEALTNLTNSFGNNILVLPNDESLNFVILAFKPPVHPYTFEEVMTNAKKLKGITQLDFPKILSRLNYFKGYGSIFQDWETPS